MKFHKYLGIPKEAQTDWGILKLKYSVHALNAAQDDRYGIIENLPSWIGTGLAEVIEVEMDEDGCTTKVLYRVPHDSCFDLVLAVIPYSRTVKTVWLNDIYDNHDTLDESVYQKVG